MPQAPISGWVAMDLDDYLEILSLIDGGRTTIDDVAAATGLPFDATRDALGRLESSDFVRAPAGRRAHDGRPVAYVVSPTGRTLLRFGCDERFKRELNEQLGGAADCAS